MERQIWWSFSYEPIMEADKELIEWFRGQKPAQCREKVMQAMRGYWEAIAAMEEGVKTNEELRLLGLNCCKELEYQSDYIRAIFQLPPRGLGNDLSYYQSTIDSWERVAPKKRLKSWQTWTFSYQPKETSPDIELIYWLKDTLGNKRKIMQALRSYWLAIAIAMGEKQTEFQLKISALNCCSMLESQSEYIRGVFSLPQKVIYVNKELSGSKELQEKSLVNGSSSGQVESLEPNSPKVLPEKSPAQQQKNKNLKAIDDDILAFN